MLVLASGSPRRHELLSQAGVPFIIRVADVDETALADESPDAFVRRLAEAKARAVSQVLSVEGSTAELAVLGADTIVVEAGEIIGKPRDRAHARVLLGRLSGRAHQVLTGVCLLDGHEADVRLATTTVTFKTLSDAEITRYLDVANWADKAGAYAIQEHAAYMVRRIDGSYTNVVGLPLCETIELLADHGVPCPA
ncbi:MAG: septum formation inhibitor Maf [Deltaproteobacteria bacterium]|nr:septum formation inhibitor Maf [Deltaproteobacteria bacterium]